MLYEKLSAPISCQIEITSECDNNCIYCYNYWRHEDNKTMVFMTKEIIEKIVSEIIKQKVYYVTFTGGEPLLNKDILFYGLKHLTQNNIPCFLNSNLNLLTIEDANKLYDIGLRNILTSISSSDEEQHNQISQRKSFKKMVKGIKIAQNAGIMVSCNMVVTEINKNDVFKTGLFLKENGVNSFNATKTSAPLNSIGFEKYMLSNEANLKVLEDLYRLKQEHSMNVGVLNCYPLCSYLDAERYSFVTERKCNAGTTGLTIGADGYVRPCSQNDEIYGNITEGLYKCWSNMKNYRRTTQLPPECIDCDYFINCNGGCRVDAKYKHGKINAPDPFMDTNNISKIKLPTPLLPQVNKMHQYSFLPIIQARTEKVGVLLSTSKNKTKPVLITHDTYELIIKFENKTFNYNDIKNYTELEDDDCELLFGVLMRDKIIDFSL